MKKVCILIMFLLTVMITSGCGNTIKTEDGKMKLTEDGVQFEDSQGNKATISEDNDQLVIESSEGKGAVGENVTLPEGYPEKLVPLYEVDKITASFETGEDEYSVIYESKASTADAMKFYKELLDKAEEKNIMQTEDGGMMSGILEEKQILVSLTSSSEDEKKLTISITIAKSNK